LGLGRDKVRGCSFILTFLLEGSESLSHIYLSFRARGFYRVLEGERHPYSWHCGGGETTKKTMKGFSIKRAIKKSFIPILASFALALSNSATSVFRHFPTASSFTFIILWFLAFESV